MTANVRSLEAIEAVRTALASFRDELEHSLSMIDIEMRRLLDWLEHDRPPFWRTQLRKAQDGVTEARSALHVCLMYPVADERPSCREERAALKQAEAKLAYCNEKAEKLRHWIREVRHEMFEYEGRISQLRDLAEIDVPQAMAVLSRLLARLHEYQAIRSQTGRMVDPPSSPSLAAELMPSRIPAEPQTATPEMSQLAAETPPAPVEEPS